MRHDDKSPRAGRTSAGTDIHRAVSGVTIRCPVCAIGFIFAPLTKTSRDLEVIRAERKEPAMKPLHRLREVRLREGVSTRSMAKKLGTTQKAIKNQETVFADISLSQLLRWRDALEVPLTDLIDSEDCESSLLAFRRGLVLVAKSAMAIRDESRERGTKILSQRILNQLVAMMPELVNTMPWNITGSRRLDTDLGRIVERSFSDFDLTSSLGTDATELK